MWEFRSVIVSKDWSHISHVIFGISLSPFALSESVLNEKKENIGNLII